MKFLKKFDTQTEYETYIEGSPILPNVSLITENNGVAYNPIHDYSNDYFTTVALESGTISFNIWSSMGTDMITSISYSTDNGSTWTTTNNIDNKDSNLVITVNVNNGDNILWKGAATQTGYYDVDGFGDYIGSFFSSTAQFNAQGNTMSMLYGDNFENHAELTLQGQLTHLFYDYNGGVCNVVNAKHLVLPATTLTQGCYWNMFYNCTSLTTAPELPATTIANWCYYQMFYNCTSLTTAPELPATTLAESCYESMFWACTSLTTAPELPATTLANGCYGYMFQGCTSLTTAPELPATTLANGCYNGMFQECTSLTTAPELPATTLTEKCYQYMFLGCTSLTKAPELPATTLVVNCYKYMLSNCSKLNYIKALFTTTPSTSYTKNWVNGVASNGTFVKSSVATWDVSGNNGVPSGWTVETV